MLGLLFDFLYVFCFAKLYDTKFRLFFRFVKLYETIFVCFAKHTKSFVKSPFRIVLLLCDIKFQEEKGNPTSARGDNFQNEYHCENI
jgi:hypothetical protein